MGGSKIMLSNFEALKPCFRYTKDSPPYFWELDGKKCISLSAGKLKYTLYVTLWSLITRNLVAKCNEF